MANDHEPDARPNPTRRPAFATYLDEEFEQCADTRSYALHSLPGTISLKIHQLYWK